VNNGPILFLYTRLPDYTYRSIEHFIANYSTQISIIRYKEDSNTKYAFSQNDSITLYYKESVNLITKVDEINPSAIILSGWNDRDYISIAKKYVNLIPVVLGLDNPWTGKFRQKVLSVLSPFYIHRFCNKVWVSGSSQYEYARRLGFAKTDIFYNLYSADTEKFYKISSTSVKIKQLKYPHTIVFVGRLVSYKQPDLLAKVFQELINQYSFNWKLIIAGEGPLKKEIISKGYENVQVIDFIAPAELPDFYKAAGAFCLPSIEEHWGVAVHEAAAAGLPLILSDSVEAGSEFLLNGLNGFYCKTRDEGSLKKQLIKIMSSTDENLLTMGGNSIMLSKKISHVTWSANLSSIMNSWNE